MKKEDQLIIELCKRNKNQQQIESLFGNNSFNTKYFLKAIDKNLIKAAVLAEILKYKIPQPIKNSLIDNAKNAIIETTLRNQYLKNELSIITKQLKINNIESILMKGLSLDFSGLRTNRDIDILIHEKDLLKSIDILKNINYEYIGNIINYNLNSKEKKDIKLQFTWNNQYQLHNKKTDLLLELHTNLFERRKIYSINLDILLNSIDDFRKRKTQDKNLHVYKFCREDLLILMCMHNAIKKSPANNTFVMRSLMDIDNLTDGINWELVIESADRYKISPFIYFSLFLSKLLLNTNIPDKVLNKFKNNCSKKQLFIENIHIKCFQGLESSSLLYSNLYKIFSPFIFNAELSFKIKHILLIHILFPPKSRMAKMYGIGYNNPLIHFTYLINPFRWIYLFIKNIFY